jgi:23S rRNA pseudouridine955/2504/2580 synthase
VRHVVVGAEREGQRIDNFLVGQLRKVPKSLIYRLLRSGSVRVNGRRARPDHRLAEGDDVRIPPVRVTPVAEHDGGPNARDLARIEAAIIHEDRDFLVIDKPSGMASHGGSGVSFGAIELLRAARPRESLDLVHRLDRDTSGVLVVARRRAALVALQAEMRAGRVVKRYLALASGQVTPSFRRIDAPLRKSVLHGGERMVRVDRAGKPSRSELRVVSHVPGATLLEVAIETGRTHQIRVHCASIGHPLAGDEKYGDTGFNRAMRDSGLKRLFLHAVRFEFALGERVFAFSTPLPAELAAVLDALGQDPSPPLIAPAVPRRARRK